MTDLDLERLGDVWRGPPDPAEMERLQRTAAAVSRRARLAQVVDIGAGVAVAAVVILLVLSNPKVPTLLMGTAAILVLFSSNMRLRKLRRIELRSLTGSTEDMLDQSIDRVETTLKHNRFSLIAMGPAVLVAIIFAATAAPKDGSAVRTILDEPIIRLAWLGVFIAGLAGVALFLVFTIRRGGRELKRLRAMREAYRHERESTAP